MISENYDPKTVKAFGDEWSRHRQSDVDDAELKILFDEYFHIFPWDKLPPSPIGFDLGGGSGRWARFVAPRVGHLHLIDASDRALAVARDNLSDLKNVTFHHATSDSAPLEPESCDFGYSLGVLHHIPDTYAALKDCTRFIKPGGLMLVYLYYRFDQRPAWFRALWSGSNMIRQLVCRLPPGLRSLTTDLIALAVYWPVSRFASLAEKLGFNSGNIPLSVYRKRSFKTLRTDSRDRFGTPLEQRFTRVEIDQMMRDAGITDIRFSELAPFWCAVGIKAAAES